MSLKKIIIPKITALLLISVAAPASQYAVADDRQSSPVSTKTINKAVENLPPFMDRLTKELAVLPGASVAIVHKDQLVFSGGFGVTDIDKKTPFTANTPTYIASGSKAFLGLIIAAMAEEGKLDLHAPIGSTYLADLDQKKLGDFGRVSLHDLLTHTHGINGDAVSFRTAYTGDMTAENFWRIAGQLPPKKKGKAFAYSNFGYVAAGYILQHHLGLPWQDIVDHYLFEKLNMHQSTARVSDLMEQNFAKPHIWFGKTRRVPLYKRDASMHPAGGHFSTAKDMAQWLIVNMNGGKLKGNQPFTESSIATIQAPHAKLEKSFYTYNRKAHGYGWYNADYQGESLYHHFGSFTGYRAHISFMPDHDLGVIVLSNDLSRATLTLPDMIANYIYDTALNKQNIDTSVAEKLAKLDQKITPIKGKDIPKRPVNAPADLNLYSGHFSHPTWGNIAFLNRDGSLIMRWGQAENAPIWTKRKGGLYLRVEIGGRGYLLKPTLNDQGKMTAFSFAGIQFKKQ